ncbi:hypothetical protein X992_4269 [Burkholderia pseudomallei MSHR5492]|nr:hypothetical protein X992_4269 [Burkholderia pseudomallei MSHR5492]
MTARKGGRFGCATRGVGHGRIASAGFGDAIGPRNSVARLGHAVRRRDSSLRCMAAVRNCDAKPRSAAMVWARFETAIRRPNSALRFGGRAAGAQPSIAGSMRASTEGQPRFIPS